MLRRILILAFSATLIAGVSVADTTTKLDREAARIDSHASKFGDNAAFEALSERLNIPTATLQSQKSSSNFGFGQLVIANELAKASGKTFDQISQEFKGGKTWSQIAQESNLKLGRIVKDAKRTDKEMKEEWKEQQTALKHPERAQKETTKETREADKRAAAAQRQTMAKPHGKNR